MDVFLYCSTVSRLDEWLAQQKRAGTLKQRADSMGFGVIDEEDE